jgi:hypothetical protein
MHLKPNNLPQFTETMERDVIPVLRQQPGFKDEVTFLPADGSSEAVAISFWEKRENVADRGRPIRPYPRLQPGRIRLQPRGWWYSCFSRAMPSSRLQSRN